ncbi:unnamed protein product [Linum trigynum]|uniref:Secreted protein n=1 Tax=Linum trigynum TaxID=586398 RepID=A0AAV2EQZ9_9ROSI
MAPGVSFPWFRAAIGIPAASALFSLVSTQFIVSCEVGSSAAISSSTAVWSIFSSWTGDVAAVGGDSTVVTLLLIRSRSRVNYVSLCSHYASCLTMRVSSLQRHSFNTR